MQFSVSGMEGGADHGSIMRRAALKLGAATMVGLSSMSTVAASAATKVASHATAPTQFVEAGGIRYAYRRFGASSGVPIILLQHFTGGLDHWDPSVTDGLGRGRPVILFDSAGVGLSGGQVPATVEAMAECVADFLTALKVERSDVLGFSMGGMVAQAYAIKYPDRVRKLVLVGTGPRAGDTSPEQAEVVKRASGSASEDDVIWLFFGRSDAGIAAGKAFWKRRHARTVDVDAQVKPEAIMGQVMAIRDWMTPKGERFADLKGIKAPTLVVNGAHDVMIPTINSYHLQQNIPNAQLILYPDAGHASHFQYPELFVEHTSLFLDGIPAKAGRG